MQVATIAGSGKGVEFDGTGFSIDGSPTTPVQVLEYDGLGVLTWVSDEMRALVHSAASPTPIDLGGSTASPSDFDIVAVPDDGKPSTGAKPWWKTTRGRWLLGAGGVLVVAALVFFGVRAVADADVQAEVGAATDFIEAVYSTDQSHLADFLVPDANAATVKDYRPSDRHSMTVSRRVWITDDQTIALTMYESFAGTQTFCNYLFVQGSKNTNTVYVFMAREGEKFDPNRPMETLLMEKTGAGWKVAKADFGSFRDAPSSSSTGSSTSSTSNSSSAAAQIAVPDFVKMYFDMWSSYSGGALPEDAIGSRIEEAGFTANVVLKDDMAAKDTNQTPSAGTPAPEGSTVTLNIGTQGD